jgi:hypothetical protein
MVDIRDSTVAAAIAENSFLRDFLIACISFPFYLPLADWKYYTIEQCGLEYIFGKFLKFLPAESLNKQTLAERRRHGK